MRFWVGKKSMQIRCGRLKTFVFLWSVFFGFFAHAELASMTLLGPNLKERGQQERGFSDRSLAEQMHAESVLNQKLFADSKQAEHQSSEWISTVRAEGMQYMTVLPNNPKLTYSEYLSGHLAGHGAWDLAETYKWKLDIQGGTFFTLGQSHVVVSDLYADKAWQNSRWTIGRKKLPWSDLDQNWQMALFQPAFAIDSLRPVEQGLAGVFWEYNAPMFSWTLFASPLYIPSMGPDVKEDNGSLVSDSRWYRPPSQQYDFNSRINTIYYNINIPETSSLVSNPGYAMQGRLGDRSRGAWVQVAAAQKPVNDLLLKRQNFKEAANARVDVKVSPVVDYHRIYSADFGYTAGPWMTSVSYLEDQPTTILPDADWVMQKLMPIKAFAFNFDGQVVLPKAKVLNIRMGYLKINGGQIVDITSNGEPDDFTLFDHRTRFTDALEFAMKGAIANLRYRPLFLSLSYLYDRDQKGSLVKSEFEYAATTSWTVLLGADILGVDDESYNPSGFLNQYRANDRIYAGMSYVF